VRIELSHPVTHRVERLLGGAVVGKDHTIGLIEVLHRHRAETLLPRCVPHQQLDVLTIDLNVLDFKVDADCGDVLCRKFLIGKFLKETTLSDLGVTQSDQLNFHIELLGLSAIAA